MERLVSRLGELVRELGFTSTPEMEQLTSALNADNLIETVQAWRPLAEAHVGELAPELWHRAQVGILVEQARLALKAGDSVYGIINDLEDAMQYASQLGLEGIAAALDELADEL